MLDIHDQPVLFSLNFALFFIFAFFPILTLFNLFSFMKAGRKPSRKPLRIRANNTINNANPAIPIPDSRLQVSYQKFGASGKFGAKSSFFNTRTVDYAIQKNLP